MRAWKCKQVIDFDKSTPTMKEERNRTVQQQMTDKSNHFQVVTLAPNMGLTQVMTLKKKIWSSASELKRTVLKVNCELWWIVKIDRQFCGTVYVISGTVALILSSRKIVNLEHVFVSF